MGATEEYSKVVDLVAKYCVHYPMLRFTCKRVEDKRTDVSTHAVQRPDISAEDEEESFLKKLNDVRIDVIKRQYGQQQVGKDLFSHLHEWKNLEIGANLVYTRPNTVSAKRSQLLIFINNRLVVNEKLKRTIEAAYAIFQPKGGYSYFVYLALSIRPELIDVNVHPTKKQVIFERQDDLAEALAHLLEEKLQDTLQNRTFEVGEAKPVSRVTFTHERLKSRDDVRDPEAHKKVRTDHTTATLDRFLKKGSASLRSDLHATRDKVAVPEKIVSVRKLIYAFEQDIDQTL